MFKMCKQFVFAIVATLCLSTLSVTFVQADENSNPQPTTRSSWGAIKQLYNPLPTTDVVKVGLSADESRLAKPGVGPMAASVNWANNVLSEAFYSLDESRSGSSKLFYQGNPMGDWSYPWRNDCCDALGNVTRYMYGGNTSWRGGLGTWNGYQQLGECKFGVNLILYRSSYGYPGGHLFLPSGYTYAPYGWRSAQPGWVIQSPSPNNHTAIVVSNNGTSINVIDSNWIGGPGKFALSRHTISGATLDSWGFRAYNPWENPRLVQ